MRGHAVSKLVKVYYKALTTVMKSKYNKQGHGPLSHIKVLLLDCLGVVLGNVFSN